MSPPPAPAQALAQLQAASARLQAGRPAEARVLLEQVLRAAPRSSDALHLYGVSLRQLGDPTSAEGPIRQAIGIDKRQPAYHVALGDVLLQLGLADKAEASYRAALALNRRHPSAARQLALLLTNAGRATDALKITTPLFAAGPVTDFGLLTAHGSALKAASRLEEALAIYRTTLEVAPQSGIAEHNVAATLGDLGRFAEADAAAGRAFAKGLDTSETRMIQGKARLALGDFENAETAFRLVLARQPAHAEAHRSLAQLIWMRTENKAQATADLDAAIQAAPDNPALRQLKAKVLSYAGDAAEADAMLQAAVARAPNDAGLRISASQAAIEAGDAGRGLVHAERARDLSPRDDENAATFHCEALLAVGRAEEAKGVAEAILRRSPQAQPALAYLATAQRLLGEERYRELYDYDAFVRAQTIDVPPGWSSLPAYLGDLTAALKAQHKAKTHPLDQSLRHGSQLPHVLQSDEPAISAFAKAVEGPIRAYIAALGRGGGPLRSRNLGGYRVKGAWSVKLRPDGGRHVDHIHAEGWLSSACYIDLPKAVDGQGRQGWLKFGEPGLPTRPKLGPEHFVKPEPGLLVLFPSYMWHGTVPFEGPGSRLTIAFDLVPDKP